MRPIFVLCTLLAIAPACRSDRVVSDFRGVVLHTPIDKPDFTLTDVNGQPYNFRTETADKVALLFFGYTHCPDVCPLHAANVAAVLKQMPFEEREAIRFVFVTTDPERDTPERLKTWLGAFDSSFIGLTGPLDEINRIQNGLRLAPARKEVVGGDSVNYLVGHAAQVIAFGRDGMARTEYPFGVRQEDWAVDLPKLARGQIPAPPVQADTTVVHMEPGQPSTAGAPLPPIQIEVAIMPAPPTTTEAALYLVIRNNANPDTLVEVSSPIAQSAMIHRTVTRDGMQHMEHVNALPLPAGSVTTLKPGDVHVMLIGLSERPATGESVPIRLRFAGGNELVLAATVVDYSEVERALSSRP
jgi:protein SCO1/2